MQNYIYVWRKNNGLYYNGWWQFLLRRWLRSKSLGFLVPFDYSQDGYDDGLQTIYVRRWGVTKKEIWKWPEFRDIEILDRLRKKGMIKRRDLYRVISSEAKLMR